MSIGFLMLKPKRWFRMAVWWIWTFINFPICLGVTGYTWVVNGTLDVGWTNATLQVLIAGIILHLNKI